jgi:hypothetical protein
MLPLIMGDIEGDSARIVDAEIIADAPAEPAPGTDATPTEK